MDQITLLSLFIGLPSVVYLGIQLELWRKRRKYKDDERQIQHKYQDNLFVLKPKKKEEIQEEKRRYQKSQLA